MQARQHIIAASIPRRGQNMAYPLVKRVFDVLVSAFLLVALLPVLAVFCLIIWAETGANPIYTQLRGITLAKYRFNILKLRTLRPGAVKGASLNSTILNKQHLNPSVTRFGAWLRLTGLDELPQLINVLLGDMSLIGPRPLSLDDLKSLQQDFPHLYQQREVVASKPGITGFWQVLGDRSKGIGNLVELELYYEQEKSFTLDLSLLALTVPVVLFARHSDAILGGGKQEN